MTSTHYSSSSIVPPDPTTTRGQSTKISLSPKGDRLIYCNGRSVTIRPTLGSSATTSSSPTILYSQHPKPVTVAKISPSGSYVASADITGLVRIWDILGTDQILKAEYRPFSGEIRDLAWDSESKRIAVVGEGKERFGHFFLVDSGSSCGEISGHSKIVNAVAIKSSRPFRAVTASDDTKLVFYNGVPFKYTSTISNHSRFVQAVTYSSDGNHFASAGSDSKIHLFDGSTGELKQAIEVGGGTIFDVKFTADNAKLVSAGADGIVRLWSLDGAKEGEWDAKAGHTNAGDQLVGLTIAGQTAIVLNLLGELIVVDLSQSGSVKARELNPTKGIAAGVKVSDSEVLAASWDGNVYRYQSSSGSGSWEVTTVQGYKMGGPVVTSLVKGKDGEVYAASMDDVVRRIKADKVDSFSASLPSASKGLAVSTDGSTLYAITSDSLLSLSLTSSDSKASFSATKLPSTPTAITASSNLVAVGFESGQVHLYPSNDISSSGPKSKLEKNRAAITSLAFSPDGLWLASGDATGKIPVFSLSKDGSADLKLTQWCFHTSRITSLIFSEDSKRAISGGLDENIFEWSVEKPMSKKQVRNAHAGGVSWVGFLGGDGSAVGSLGGSDGAFKTWMNK